jgi:hypothetical protein
MLCSEYCRDLKRFALGQSIICPKPPQNYFDPAALAAFEGATPEMLSSAAFISRVTAGLSSDWQAPARRLYTAWLASIAGKKAEATRDTTRLDPAFAAAFNALGSSETHAHFAPP